MYPIKRKKYMSIMLLNFIPLIALFFVLLIGMSKSSKGGSLIYALVSVFLQFAVGQGWAAIAFVVSGFIQHWVGYLVTMLGCGASGILTIVWTALMTIEIHIDGWVMYFTLLIDLLIFVFCIVEWVIVKQKRNEQQYGGYVR